MGDRGNICLHDNGQTIYLYTHWRGSDLAEIAKAALVRGKSRWDDPAYLYRVIFQELIGKDTGLTGFGLSGGICDNEHPVIHIDASKQSVWIDAGNPVTFDEFTA